MRARNIFAVARRERIALFRNPASFIFLGAFAFLCGIFFFYLGEFFLVRQATCRSLFELLPFFLSVFTAAAAMRAFAEEERAGVLDHLRTLPLTEPELVAGKFLTIFLLALTALGTTLPIPAIVLSLGRPDPGEILAGYLGLILLASAMTAIGLWASSRTSSQVTAFILAAVVNFLLLMLDAEGLLRWFPGKAKEAVRLLAFSPHYEALSRGVLDLSDLLYFAGVTLFFLVLTGLSLRARRGHSREESEFDRTAFGALVFVNLLLVVLLTRSFFLRADLTSDRRFTPAAVTRSVLRNLEDPVLVRVFLSESNLPSEMRNLPRDIRDLLGEFAARSRGKLHFTLLDPASDPEVAGEAERAGIPSVPTGVARGERMEVANVYAGMEIIFRSTKKSIPRIDPSRLEYDLVQTLRKAIGENLPLVVLESSGKDHSPFNDLDTLRRFLEMENTIRSLSLNSETLPTEAAAVLVPEPTRLDTGAWRQLSAYRSRGGKIVFFTDGGGPIGQPLPDQKTRKELAVFGASPETGTVLDASCEILQVPHQRGNFRIFIPMEVPAFVRVPPEQLADHPITRGLEVLRFPWTVSYRKVPKPGRTFTVLARSSPRAELSFLPPAVTSPASIPDPPRKGRARTLALLAEEGTGAAAFVGSAWSVSDALFRGADPSWMVPNLLFIANLVDHFTTGGKMTALRTKIPTERALDASLTEGRIAFYKLLGTLFSPLLVLLLGGLVYARRPR
ncbi:MAG: hypothetical protein D6679_12705 [Candidatus Hydrogenedentota bacterium]|nr:MAG: hypothetical protein D6679_12705 [Candidatus Hydrogenedentota bacterium]